MRWAYKTMKVATSGFLGGKLDEEQLERELNSYGQDGWELVNVFVTNQGHGSTRSVVAVFKRPA